MIEISVQETRIYFVGILLLWKFPMYSVTKYVGIINEIAVPSSLSIFAETISMLGINQNIVVASKFGSIYTSDPVTCK